jgi:DNA sulfur modification protein DndB
MSFLSKNKIDDLLSGLTHDLSILGKLYKTKKNQYFINNVNKNEVESYLDKGWEIESSSLKTKIKIRKTKDHLDAFKDDVWCQLYELGFRQLNSQSQIVIPCSNEDDDSKTFDIIAINEEVVLLIDCVSSEKRCKAPLFTEKLNWLTHQINGLQKGIFQIFGRDIKIKYILATRNLRIDSEREDLTLLKKTKSFLYNDNTYDYINSLIKNYKSAASYQVMGLLFKAQFINSNKIKVPAVEGEMGGKKYYMFSLEPDLLLKMGFILHRTRANEAEMPTYQRLLVPSRLQGITKFINDGGYFPNSLIVNFSQVNKIKIQFEASSRTENTSSRFGTLNIPNAYSIAYIIDGQHRLYGYANSKYKKNNTIPVVAFLDLTSMEQLEIFMDINQNQKAVSPSLRLTLEEDLFWNSDRADSRLKALRSSIIKALANLSDGPLFNKITVGEDAALLKFKPFSTALTSCGILPVAKGNIYDEGSTIACLYNVNNKNHSEEMDKARLKIVHFLNYCYEFVDEKYPDIFEKEKYFILSNRGSYAFISLIGSLNSHLTLKGELSLNSTPKERFLSLEKYLTTLMEGLQSLSKEDETKQLTLLGSGADIKWLRFFQTIINTKHIEYNPIELIDWKERQDEDIQNEGRAYGVAIEKYMKKVILEKMKLIFAEVWDLEINSIKRECQKRAEEEKERHYKEGLGQKTLDWTEMFNITDYKKIIESYWTKTPENSSTGKFKTFQNEFAIDIGEGFNSKSAQVKWISRFNSYRNMWAHEGTKETRLNKEEVSFLKRIYDNFYN